MNLRDNEIVILGGGPGGLAVARLLHLHGVGARVLERDACRDARTQGGSLDLTEDKGLRALAAMGLTAEFDAKARPQGQTVRILDVEGKTLLDLSEGDFELRRPEIDRRELRHLLLGSLPDGIVRWGTQAHTVTPRPGGGYVVDVENGAPIDADLVIACDGIGSVARPLVTGVRPSYAGVTFLQGEIKNPDETAFAARSVGAGAMFACGDNRAIMGQRNGDGSIRVYFALRVDEDHALSRGTKAGDERGVRAGLLEIFDGWGPDLLGILDEIDGGFAWWPLHGVPSRQSWPGHSGLTLVGDAAHVMPPFSGQGVNMALVDAVELVEELTSPSHATADEAIAAYEERMLARMEPAIEETIASQNQIISPDGARSLLEAFGVTA